jgi:hypothetical protein
MFVEAHVAIEKNAIDSIAVGLREPHTLLLGQRHERGGLAGALGDGLELIAEAGDELF